jgi:acetoin utilization deacetylase AcuC-like enzyme
MEKSVDMKIPVVWHPAYDVVSTLPWYAKLAVNLLAATPVRKYAHTKAQLSRRKYRFLSGRYVSREELSTVHADEYIDEVVGLAEAGTAAATVDVLLGDTSLDTDCAPFGPEALDLFMAACGGTLLAVEEAQRCGVAINLSGGFHHARAASGHGFCVFNDVALAAVASGVRTLIVDADVHQGDGTVELLADNPLCYTLSFHQEEGYPEPRATGSMDIEMPNGQEDDDYLEGFTKYLEEALQEFEPELIIYLAGADPLDTDQLGGLCLTGDGLAARDYLLFTAARDRKVPVAVVLAGGYSDLETTVAAHVRTCEVAASVFARHP